MKAMRPYRARTRQQVRRVRHRLHAAGDDDVRLARSDHEVGEVDGLEAGETDLIDGGGVDGHRDTALDGRLTSGDLTPSSLKDLTHQHEVDTGGFDAGAIEHALDRGAPEVRRAERREGSRQLPNGRSSAGDDDAS